MQLIILIISILSIFIHFSSCRAFTGGIDGQFGRMYIKRADSELMSPPKYMRYDEFLNGPEIFNELGGTGRLSNLQRLG
ncbi:unnamed protein product [Caenorhabditis angaria]|uniref:Uncharacterized protein n=1 Tax=Caenorhabditis angaria TaxID=860376 RepID=A0A9P1MX07_9PELO|nr:unnamed protein product [Caenorhabditis angaria]